jgi:hypothetical protein
MHGGDKDVVIALGTCTAPALLPRTDQSPSPVSASCACSMPSPPAQGQLSHNAAPRAGLRGAKGALSPPGRGVGRGHASLSADASGTGCMKPFGLNHLV